MKLSVVCLFVLCLAAGTAAATTWFDYGGDQYALSDLYGTWTDVQTWGQGAGANLVAINDSAEDAWILSQFGETEHLWIGLYQEGAGYPTAGWKWITGEPVTFTDWQSNQPDFGSGNDIYGMINVEEPGKWHNVPLVGFPQANAPYRGIVERSSAQVVPEASTFALALSGLGVMSGLRRVRRK